MVQHPSRFTRVVLHLPAALDRIHPHAVRRAAALSEALASRDQESVSRFVRGELPDDLVGTSAEAYVAARSAFLMSCDLVPLLERLTTDVPVPEPSVLAAVEADVLVIGEEGDPVHPAAVARVVAGALPRARLVLFARPASMFRERARLLGTIREHLTGPSGGTRGDRLGDAASGTPARE